MNKNKEPNIRFIINKIISKVEENKKLNNNKKTVFKNFIFNEDILIIKNELNNDNYEPTIKHFRNY